jgi:hypothetical protein
MTTEIDPAYHEATREYSAEHAPLIVAAFVEAHEELFAAWLQENNIDPEDGLNYWRKAIAQQYWAIRGVANLGLTVTVKRDLLRSHRAPK